MSNMEKNSKKTKNFAFFLDYLYPNVYIMGIENKGGGQR